MIRRLSPPLASLLLSGCFVDPGVVTTSAGATTTATTATSEDASTTSSSTTAPATTDATSTTTTTTTTTEATTAVSTSAASTTGETTDVTTSTTTTTTTTTTTGDPGVELLVHADLDACELPLWCYDSPNVQDGVPGRVWAQACFQSAQEPPLQLLELDYVIADSFGTLENQRIEVYTPGMNGPSQLIDSRDLGADQVSPGVHAVALQPPIVLATAEFCVGLSVGSQVLAQQAAVGVAVDGVAPAPATKFLKVKSATAGCDLSSFVDIAVAKPNPTGNWCLAVVVDQAF